jgi:hypothetical protein
MELNQADIFEFNPWTITKLSQHWQYEEPNLRRVLSWPTLLCQLTFARRDGKIHPVIEHHLLSIRLQTASINTRCEVLAVALLQIRCLWNVIFCHCVRSSWRIEEYYTAIRSKQFHSSINWPSLTAWPGRWMKFVPPKLQELLTQRHNAP